MHKFKNYSVIVVFMLMLALPIFNISFKGGDRSDVENRYLAPMPDIFVDGGINPNAYSMFTDWLSDHIGFREDMVRLVGDMKFKLFGISPSDKVHIGKDDWYYYTGDNNLEIGAGTYPLTQEDIDGAVAVHKEIERKLAAQGREYVVILPTSKVSIYPEHMRYGKETVIETPMDKLANALKENSDIKVIPLKETMLEAKNDGLVYFKNDTHWNYVGAYKAYEHILEKLNEWNLLNDDPVPVTFQEEQFCGEFGGMMGNAKLLGTETVQKTVLQQQNAVRYVDADMPNGLLDLIRQEYGMLRESYQYVNESNPDGPAVLLYGDSMFAHWNMTELLAEHCSTLTFVWSRNLSQKVIDAVDPDIVIYESTERFINSVDDTNSQFIQNKLNDFSMEVTDQHFDGNTLNVTVKNTGKQAWRYQDQVKCTVFLNGQDSGIRVKLAPNQTVQPGESVEFHFADVKPQLNETAEIVMLQETVAYFPNHVPVNFS